jgi:hypothetical protein
MVKRNHKVILIGAKGYQRTAEDVQVDCFLWSQIALVKNIRDYDTIILDLLPLENESNREEIEWDYFCSLLDFPSTMDILVNGGMIIVIGDPRFRINLKRKQKKSEKDSEKSKEREFLYWTGIDFIWDSEPGDTVSFENDYYHRQYSEYVNKLNRWDYSLATCRINIETLSLRFDLDFIEKQSSDIHLSKDLFCYNRYKNGLAFALRYQYRKNEYRNWRVVEVWGPIVILPKISLPEDDAVRIVLTEICGITTNLPEPDWLSEFSAPGQKAIDDEITGIKGELENTFDRLKKAEEQKQECRKCLKLLYEREFALEPAVRDILRGLGAHVEDPVEKNKEDGWIVVKLGDATKEGVLEIKSTKSDMFSEEGRKQLLDWIDRGRTLRQKNFKGIFIGNSAVDKPYKERPWAFSDSWSKAAELSGICSLKTENLYLIHLLNARGKLDLDQFWKDLFETNGIFDMKKYWDALAPKEKIE